MLQFVILSVGRFDGGHAPLTVHPLMDSPLDSITRAMERTCVEKEAAFWIRGEAYVFKISPNY